MLQQDYHSAHNQMQEIHHKLLCTPKAAQRLEMLTEYINILRPIGGLSSSNQTVQQHLSFLKTKFIGDSIG